MPTTFHHYPAEGMIVKREESGTYTFFCWDVDAGREMADDDYTYAFAHPVSRQEVEAHEIEN